MKSVKDMDDRTLELAYEYCDEISQRSAFAMGNPEILQEGRQAMSDRQLAENELIRRGYTYRHSIGMWIKEKKSRAN